MPLTPSDVANKQFRVAFRGYALHEVDTFLDEVERELARLLTERASGGSPEASEAAPVPDAVAAPVLPDAPTPAAPTPAAPTPAAPTPAAPTDGAEGQQAALRTLLLAQRTADQAVAEARAEAAQLLSAAHAEADAALAAAREQAQTTVAAAEREAAATLAASTERAAGLDEEIAARLEAALGDLDRQRQRLEDQLEQLRAFEREYRTRLRAYLEGQLRELDSRAGAEDQGVGVPAGAGAAAVERTPFTPLTPRADD